MALRIRVELLISLKRPQGSTITGAPDSWPKGCCGYCSPLGNSSVSSTISLTSSFKRKYRTKWYAYSFKLPLPGGKVVTTAIFIFALGICVGSIHVVQLDFQQITDKAANFFGRVNL